MTSKKLKRMWKKKDKIHQDLPTQDHHHHNHQNQKAELEILKTVAQAWLSRHEPSNNSSDSSSDEFDARRKNFLGQPTRFRIEALRRKNQGGKRLEHNNCSNSNWDFNQSLLDPFEIVAVSKRLEQGLVLDNNGFSGLLLEEENRGVFDVGKRKESKNSLRNLFNIVSGRRSI